MQGTNRIVVNTVILYTKILVCMAISLWTVPLVLHALGKEDYGLYNLIAGVIVMLAFLNGAMTLSIQRFLSVAKGEHNEQKLLEIYNLSIVLHVLIGLAVVILAESSFPLLFKYTFNISPDKWAISHTLFHYLVISMFFTVLAVPFDAVLNAYENMVAIAVFGIIEYVSRLGIAIALPLFDNRLGFYGCGIMSISIIMLFAKCLFIHRRYTQMAINISYCHNKKLFSEMTGFAGWNTLTSLSIMTRNQGIAVVLNHFFGTIINAAYGIGNQINGILGYFSQTIQKSVNPQLMESHGAHDMYKLEYMSIALTKFTCLSMCAIAIPLFIELPFILKLWLTTVPEHTLWFTRLIIILSLLFQFSSGLMSAIQSTGNVKWYTICVSISTLSTLPVGYTSLALGYIPESALIIACILELFCMGLRMYFVKMQTGFSIINYFKKSIYPVLTVSSITAIAVVVLTESFEPGFFRLLLTGAVSISLFCILTYKTALEAAEQEFVSNILKKLFHRI